MATTSLRPPFVSHDAAALGAAVVLRPSAAVDRLEPLKAEPSPIAVRAIDQHAVMVRTLRYYGVAVTELEPADGTPAESLIGDAALVLPKGAVLGRPSNAARRAGVARIEAALAELGVPIIGRIEAPGLLDAGDVVFGGDTLYVGVPRAGAGLRPRSNELGRRNLEELAAAQGLRTVEVSVAPDVLRLRNVVNFVARDTVVAAAERVDVSALANLRLVEVVRGEEYAAGVLPLGERRVLANLRFRESIGLLRKAKVAVEAIDMWEFGKAGAGPFSLVIAAKRG